MVVLHLNNKQKKKDVEMEREEIKETRECVHFAFVSFFPFVFTNQ